MDARELRIGNILFNGNVCEITEDDVSVFDGYQKWKQSRMREGFEPIPITEQWLINFGFEITYSSKFRLKFDHNSKHEFGFDFSHTPNKSMEGFRFYGKYIKIKYVHQLQNLYFSLTNEELKLN